MGDGKACCTSCGAGKACEADLRYWEVVYGKKPSASLQAMCAEALGDKPVGEVVGSLIHFLDFVVSRKRFDAVFAALSAGVLSGAITRAIVDEEIVTALATFPSNVPRIRDPQISRFGYVLDHTKSDTARHIRTGIAGPWRSRMQSAQSDLATRGRTKTDRRFFDILYGGGDWSLWETEVLLDYLRWEYQGKAVALRAHRTERYNEEAGLDPKDTRVALLHASLIHREHEVYVAYLAMRRRAVQDLRQSCSNLGDKACRAAWNQGFLARLDDQLDAERRSALDGWFLGPIDDSDPEVRAAKRDADAKQQAAAERQADLKARVEAERARQSQAEKERAAEAFKSQLGVAVKFVEGRAKDRAAEARKKMMDKATGFLAKGRILLTGKPPKHNEPSQPSTSQPPATSQPAAPMLPPPAPSYSEPAPSYPTAPPAPRQQPAPSQQAPAPSYTEPAPSYDDVPLYDDAPLYGDQPYNEPAPQPTKPPKPSKRPTMSATELLLAFAQNGEGDDLVELALVVTEAWVELEDRFEAGDEEVGYELLAFLEELEVEFAEITVTLAARDLVDACLKLLEAASRLGWLDNDSITDQV
jgi:hypothetical protein